MKLKDKYLLRQLADIWVGIPSIDGMLELDRMLTLNETGAFLWKRLEAKTDVEALASALCAEYGISFEEARTDAQAFCQKLRAVDFLDN